MGIYYDKILGSFVGAAAGDALGAITETYSMDKINEVYGGPIRDFRKPPMDNNAQTNECGQVQTGGVLQQIRGAYHARKH